MSRDSVGSLPQMHGSSADSEGVPTLLRAESVPVDLSRVKRSSGDLSDDVFSYPVVSIDCASNLIIREA